MKVCVENHELNLDRRILNRREGVSHVTLHRQYVGSSMGAYVCVHRDHTRRRRERHPNVGRRSEAPSSRHEQRICDALLSCGKALRVRYRERWNSVRHGGRTDDVDLSERG